MVINKLFLLWSIKYMKTLYNFFRPTSSSSSHALAASAGLEEVKKDLSKITSDVSELGLSGLKTGATVIGGLALFEYLSGKLMLAYVGSATINAFGGTTVGTLAKQLSYKAIETILKYPVGSLATTIFANLAIHPEDMIKLMKNSYNIVTDSVKTIIDSIKLSYEVYQTVYTSAWEQFEPSIKNLKSKDLHEANKVKLEDNAIEMTTYKVTNESKEEEEAEDTFVADETSIAQETKAANNSSWLSSAYNACSSISATVSSWFTSEDKNSTEVVKASEDKGSIVTENLFADSEFNNDIDLFGTQSEELEVN